MTLSIRALRRAIVPSLLSLPLIVGACSSTPAASTAPKSVVDGSVTVTAASLAFDTSEIDAPAGEPFTIAFTNNEGVPHNLSVYTAEGGERLVLGNVVNEGETDDVEVPALDPGTYYFVCDLHTTMNGQIVVTARGG